MRRNCSSVSNPASARLTVHTRSVVAVDVSLWLDDVEVEGEDCDVLRVLDVCEGWFGFTPLRSTV